jgi:hypothetical protein
VIRPGDGNWWSAPVKFWPAEECLSFREAFGRVLAAPGLRKPDGDRKTLTKRQDELISQI